MLSYKEFCNISPEKIEKILHTDIKKGLTTVKVDEFLSIYGKNEIKKHKNTAWHIILRQVKSSFVYLLLFAAIISFALQQYFDAFFIIIFVLINTILGFIQEYKSSQTAELLNQHLVSQSKVKRNNEYILIPTTDIVPGDIIMLEAGDIVPADIRIISQNNLYVDESVLTGESAEVFKKSNTLKNSVKDIFEANNICFSGTSIKSGMCEGIVINTGKNTEIGRITDQSLDIEEQSILENDLSKISKFILLIVIFSLLLSITINLILKGTENIVAILLFAISLAVSVIPESLSTVVILSLSRGAYKLSKHNVIVKRISSVQDIGAIEVLCTDKTGTITENILRIEDIYSKNRKETLKYLALASSFNIEKKDSNNSFDIAIFNEIPEKYKAKIFNIKKIKSIPFDPERKKNSKLVSIDNKNILILRGAPEEILKSCNIPDKEKNKILQLENKYGEHGRRTMAVAIKEMDKKIYYLSDEYSGFKFLGMISLVDPIKESTYAAIKKAKQKHIDIKIITGDSGAVAGAVAHKLGLVNKSNNVILGSDIDNMSDKELEKKVLKYNVFARCTPMHKYRIIKAIEKNKKVAFLGEGMNDAPALKAAHVGIVVNDASDIARDSADIILLNKNLNVIIDGIILGRETYANISKYIKITLSSNFGNFYAIVLASFFIKFLPMLPIQILLLNLLSDFPLISISTDNVDDEELQRPSKFILKDFLHFASLLGIISTMADLTLFFIFVKEGEQVLQTAWFIESVITELVIIYSLRTKKIFYKAKKMSKTMYYLIMASILLAILIPLFFKNQFGFTSLSLHHYLILGLLIGTYFIISEVVKLIYYRIKNYAHAISYKN